MKPYVRTAFVVALLGLMLLAAFQRRRALSGAATTSPLRPASVQPATRILEDYGRLPLSFEANQGQADPRVRFLARGRGYTLFLTSTEAVLSLRRPVDAEDVISKRLQQVRRSGLQSTVRRYRSSVLRMQLVGTNRGSSITGRDELLGTSNYFTGDDPKRWRTSVPNYARVEYKDVYPGVSLVYYGNQGQLEYDFVVAPGANPEAIEFQVEGAETLKVDGQGDLVLGLGGQEIRVQKPLLYQQANETRHQVVGSYVLRKDRVRFWVPDFDHRRALVIDPVLSYSTYLGGSGGFDGPAGIAVDGSGHAFVTGLTNSADFPTRPRAFDTTLTGPGDVFVTQLTADGRALRYSTFLGGSDTEQSNGIAVDGSGHAYVTGVTFSSDFPITPEALQTKCKSASPCSAGTAFVTKLSADGSKLVYSTYLGGNQDNGQGIAVDGIGHAYVAGGTGSGKFPTTPRAFQRRCKLTQFGFCSADGFVTKFSVDGSHLVYSTLIGGRDSDNAAGIAVDGSGHAYVTGLTDSNEFPITRGAFQEACKIDAIFHVCQNAFVTKLSADGSRLVYSTFLGGSAFNIGTRVAVDGARAAYVTGETQAPDFPTTPGAFQTTPGGGSNPNDSFVTKLSTDGSRLVYSTYLGGDDGENLQFLAVDRSGHAYVAGGTASKNFPVSPDAFQGVCGLDVNDECRDAFLTKFSFNGSKLMYSTYLGGSDSEAALAVAVDKFGSAYVAGFTLSSDFPVTPGAFQTTKPGFAGGAVAFISKFAFATCDGNSPGECDN